MAKNKNLPITTPNKDIVVSWIYTWSHQQEMSINEQRVVLRILEQCQNQLKGIKIKDNLRQIDHDLFTVTLKMPVSDAFFSDYKPKDVEDTLRTLSHRSFEYKNYDTDEWWMCDFIESPHVKYRTGMMEFRVDNKLWDVFLNFTKGYREFELNKALALPTTYSLRFYMLMSNQKRPFDITIEKLKKWLGIDDKLYKDKNGKDRIDHLEERVIKPSKKALDESCPWTFDYLKIRESPNNKRSKVTGFKFIPVPQPQFRDPDLEKENLIPQISASRLIDEHVYDYMTQSIGFTAAELNKNKELLIKACEVVPDFIGELARLKGTSREKYNPKGYIIASIKGMVQDYVSGKKK